MRGLGAMLAVEFVADRESKAPDAAFAAAVVDRARDLGLLLLKCGPAKNVVRFLPPLVATDEEIDRGMDLLRRGLPGGGPACNDPANGARPGLVPTRNRRTSSNVYTINDRRGLMSLIKRLLGKSDPPKQRIRVCVECGMPIAEHKDWCSILRGQIEMKLKATGSPAPSQSN